MDELSDFERRLAAGLDSLVGPRREVRVEAITRAAVQAANPSRWPARSLRSGWTAENPRLLAVGVALILLVIGGAAGFAAASLVNQPPAIAGPSPSTVPVAPLPSAPTGLESAAPSWPGEPPFAMYWKHSDRPVPANRKLELWVARLDGSDAQRLTEGTARMAWSADGRRLVVVTTEDERLSFAEVGDTVGPLVDSGIETGAGHGCPDRSGRLNPCQIERIALSPDGRSAAFSQDCTGGISGCFNVAVVNLETGRLTVLEPTMSSMFYPIGSVTWSPDSKTVAFDRRRDARDRVEASDIYLIDADGTNFRKLDAGDLSAVAPAFSPDGARIAFTSHTCCSIPDVYTVESDLYTVGLDGSHLQRITADGDATAPGWTGDGRIRFLRDPKTRDPFEFAIPRLWLINPDGGDETELPEPVLPSGLTHVMPYGPDSGLLVQPDPR